MHLVKINTGFVFSIKKKKKKTKKPIIAFGNRKKNRTENTSLSRRIKEGVKHWSVQSTVACHLKITLFIKKIEKTVNNLCAPGSLDLPAKSKK